MKRIKGVRKTTHKLIMKATQDYYMGSTDLIVIKYLFGERLELDNEQKHAVFCIRANLLDEIYCKNLI